MRLCRDLCSEPVDFGILENNARVNYIRRCGVYVDIVDADRYIMGNHDGY